GIFGQYRQSRIKALAISNGIVMSQGWQDRSQPLLEQVSEASTLDYQSERLRLIRALEETTAECRRISKRFTSSSQKESAAIFDLYSHL
ncbi:phosphoenolpyruvate-utilizing N-terminal domain-containing protein, partial [Xenorhabdus bovienii]|uniref:phosphoenolpyruvate-utilizing N-terminal domain-containing protein n=1 Tax=Xenorhabdus bovienii TaxID=40576 RepID=UPI0030C680E9|nr:phosphoenolpyruvate-protein phosphotransferase PtsP [Xenorhabdus bovienii]